MPNPYHYHYHHCTPSLLLRLTVLSCLLHFATPLPSHPLSLVSKVKTDKQLTHQTIPLDSIYIIEAERVSSTQEDGLNKCSPMPKSIKVASEFEKFRVGAGEHSRQQSIYDTLTTLHDRQNAIESFRILNEHIMLIMANGTVFFLKNTKAIESNPSRVALNIEVYSKDKSYKFVPLIASLGPNAFVATEQELSFCQPAIAKCIKIKQFKGVPSLLNLYAYKSEANDKVFIFFLTGAEVVTYEINSNAEAVNERKYTAAFFGLQDSFIQEIIYIPGRNKMLLLDYYAGLLEVSYTEGEVGKLVGFHSGDISDQELFDQALNHRVDGHEGERAEKGDDQTSNKPKRVYEQYGCRHMTQQRDGEYIGLQCSLTRKSYFVLQLVRSSGSSTYAAQQPIFFSEVLTGIGSSADLVMAHIFSGVRLFWSSPHADRPYPYDYQTAGSIFLHNARDSQIAVLDNQKVIYISTEDELRIYELAVEAPKLMCYSVLPVREEYKLTYTYN